MKSHSVSYPGRKKYAVPVFFSLLPLCLLPSVQGQINLNGGTTTLPVVPLTSTANTLGHYGFHSNSDAFHNLQDNQGLMRLQTHPNFNAQVTLTNGPGNRGLDFDNDADWIGSGAVALTDNYQNLFLGTLNVTSAGNWQFRNAGDDDRGTIWLDTNRDGFFDSTVWGLGSDRGEQLSWEDGGTKTVNLAAGQYMIAIGHTEFGGGSGLDMRFRSPVMGAEAIIKPADAGQAGIWSFTNLHAGALSAINVNSSSTMQLDAMYTAPTLNFTASGLTLTTTSGNGALGLAAGALQVTGATTLNGTTTINTQSANVTLSGVVGGGAADLTKTGSRVLTLGGANTYSGTTTISGGTVVLGNNAGLGDEAGKTVINGGTLEINGFRAGANGNELVEVQGTGSLGQGAIINSGGGQTSAFRRITLTGDTLVRSDGRIDMRDTGGASTFTMGGFTLSKVGGAEFALVNTAITNPGSVNVNQGTFRLEGSTDFDGSGTVSVVNGATFDFWNNTQSHTVNVALAAGANLTANGGGGPTLTGTVTANGAANIVTNNNITLAGTLAGAGTINKTGAGILTLSGNNSIAAVNLSAGTLRVSHQNALGGTTSLGVDAGETLDFAGNFTFNGVGTPLASISVNDGTLANSAAGTKTVIDIPLNVGATSDVTFTGAGNLDIMRGFGNGASLAYFDGLNERIFDNQTVPGADPRNNMQGYLEAATGPNDGVGVLSGHLNYNDDAAFDARAAALGAPGFDPNNGPTAGNHFAAAWWTRFTPNESGVWQFQAAGRVDDNASFWIDTTGTNGVFDAVGDRFYDTGCCPVGTGPRNTPSLVAGQSYLLGFAMQDTGGGGNFQDMEFKSPSGTFRDLNPTANPGLFQAQIQPDTAVTKSGAGTVTLFGSNTFNGPVNLQGGTLVAANDNALGTAGGHVAASIDTTVGFRQNAGGGNITVAGDNITGLDGAAAGQSGAIVNINGANQFLGDISAASTPNSQQLTISSESGSLTIGAPGGGNTLDTNYSRLTFAGNGDVVVNSSIIGESLAGDVVGVRGYVFNGNAIREAGDPNQIQSIITDRSLDLNGDAAFQAMFNQLTQVDNYGTTFLANLVIPDRLGGNTPYDITFRGLNADDANMFWLDLDKNGSFSTSGSAGNEQLINVGCCPSNFTATVNSLAPGTYALKLQHREGGGGSALRPQIDLGDGNGFRTLDPGNMSGGVELQVNIAPIKELVKTGLGTTTLAGNNSSYPADFAINQGTLVAAHNNALGDTVGKTVVADGATLGLQENITIPAAESITIRGLGAGNNGALRNVSGDNTISGDIVAAPTLADVRIGSTAGTLNIKGNVDMRTSNFLVGGAGDIVIDGVLGSSNPNYKVGTAGLLETVYNQNNIDNPTAGAIVGGPSGQLSVRAGSTQSGAPWNFVGDNETIVYQGQFYDADGKFAFGENIDDNVRVFIDGVPVLVNNTWNVPTTTASTTNNTGSGAGTLNFGMGPGDDGWHDIEFRFSNGGGGAGPVAGNGWTSTFGFGVNTNPGIGFTSADGSAYTLPIDPGNASLLRYNVTNAVAANRLTKDGPGTLTLTNANTYTGGTVINEGILQVTNTSGSGLGTGNVTVNAGGTLGGNGFIGTAANPVTTTIQAGGRLAPGNSPGVLTLFGTTVLAPGSFFDVEVNVGGITTPGDGTNGTDLLTINGTIDFTGALLTGTLCREHWTTCSKATSVPAT
jgi:autotransporter-associated beta strand protein